MKVFVQHSTSAKTKLLVRKEVKIAPVRFQLPKCPRYRYFSSSVSFNTSLSFRFPLTLLLPLFLPKKVWDAALVLLRYLRSSEGSHLVAGKRIAELGAGTGVVSKNLEI